MTVDFEDQSVLLRKIEQHALREQNLSSLPSLDQTSDNEGSDGEEERAQFEALRRRRREAEREEENDKENRGDLQDDVSCNLSTLFLALTRCIACRIWRPLSHHESQSNPYTAELKNPNAAPLRHFSLRTGSWTRSGHPLRQRRRRISFHRYRMNLDPPVTAFLSHPHPLPAGPIFESPTQLLR
jgi:hypothetical protein